MLSNAKPKACGSGSKAGLQALKFCGCKPLASGFQPRSVLIAAECKDNTSACMLPATPKAQFHKLLFPGHFRKHVSNALQLLVLLRVNIFLQASANVKPNQSKGRSCLQFSRCIHPLKNMFLELSLVSRKRSHNFLAPVHVAGRSVFRDVSISSGKLLSHEYFAAGSCESL